MSKLSAKTASAAAPEKEKEPLARPEQKGSSGSTKACTKGCTKGRPRTFDREEALQKALRIFWELGYEPASVAAICKAIGINPPSFYAAFGSIDVVIPNAGYEGEYQLIQDCTYESYMKVYGVNVFGVVFTCKYAAPYMIKQGKGAVVVIASNGSYTTAAGMSAYCSSKHACAGVAKSVALELGPHGIHCNYICPARIHLVQSFRVTKGELRALAAKEKAAKEAAKA